MRWWSLGILLMATPAWAHDGPVDACGGHSAGAWVHYGARADGSEIVPSEPGEYHLHLTPAQVEEARRSLWAYRTAHGDLGDLGSFEVDGVWYDILQYTRQGEAIVHCQVEPDITKSGIVRVRE